MMPLTLFVWLTLLTLRLYGALGGLLVLPYWLIVGGGIHTDQVGFALLPFSIVIGTASRFAGRLSDRIGPRWPPTIRPIVTGVGFAPMTTVDPRARFWGNVLPGLVVIALGMPRGRSAHDRDTTNFDARLSARDVSIRKKTACPRLGRRMALADVA